MCDEATYPCWPAQNQNVFSLLDLFGCMPFWLKAPLIMHTVHCQLVSMCGSGVSLHQSLAVGYCDALFLPPTLLCLSVTGCSASVSRLGTLSCVSAWLWYAFPLIQFSVAVTEAEEFVLI